MNYSCTFAPFRPDAVYDSSRLFDGFGPHDKAGGFMKFDASMAVLLLVDMQQGFCGAQGSSGRRGRDVSVLKPAVDSAARILPVCRAAKIPVIFTRMAFAPDYSDGGLLTAELRPHLKPNNDLRVDTSDAEIMPDIAPLPGELIINKQRYSAVLRTELDTWLRSRGRNCIIVGGVTTGMCVESTVRDLGQRDFKVFVVPEACGDFNADNHKRSLDVFALAFARVVPEQKMIAAVKAGGADFAIDPRFDW
jgi:nicotinamidase-related amidase